MGPQLPWNRASSPPPTPAAVASLPACADLSQHHTPLPEGALGPVTWDTWAHGARGPVTSVPPSVPLSLLVGESGSGPRTQAELRLSSSRFLQGLQADIEQEV